MNFLGNNKQSKAFYLTEENISPILEGKEVYIQSLESLYEQSSAKKREFIMDMFGVRKEDIIMLNQKPNLFFSQPLINDCSLTEDEYIEILRDCVSVIPESIVVHRLTGDGDKKILVAPMWSGNKKHVWNRIQKEVLV